MPRLVRSALVLLTLSLFLPLAGQTPSVVRPFPGFPDVPTTARAGEYVLTPSYNWLVDAEKKGADKGHVYLLYLAHGRAGCDGFAP